MVIPPELMVKGVAESQWVSRVYGEA